MLTPLKRAIKRALVYRGAQPTEYIRTAIAERLQPGWPYCPADEGDLLYLLAATAPDRDALEVGLATGSTAAYILAGLRKGRLVSIDYAQDAYQREGISFLQRCNFQDRHELLEDDSIVALPRLHESGRRFHLAFLDGWKTFDHVWVDTFYAVRMLEVGGFVVFDDAHMHAVRKCMSLLVRYYGFETVDIYERVGGWRQRFWHILSRRSLTQPYAALMKTQEIAESIAGRQFNFWQAF